MDRVRLPGKPESSLVSLVGVFLAVFVAIAVFGPSRSARADDREACDAAPVVAKALPATVNITVVKVVKSDDPDAAKTSPEEIEIAYGSGVIVDPSGVIVTNKHVVKDAVHFWVTFSDRVQVDAQLIGAASLTDVAVLKVNRPGPLPILTFANSDNLRVGQPDIAVGNPLGLGTSVSTGVVSALNRDLMRSPFDEYIQTDATINPGNSGGALLNCSGELIGINTALVSNSKLLGSIGLGFALPANEVSFVFHKLLDSTMASPTWVGLHMQDLTARLALTFGRPNMAGAIVTAVDPNSPASQAGIVTGDVITTINGQTMWDARGILRTIIMQPQGQPIVLAVCKGNETKNVTLKGEAWPHMMEERANVLASASSLARAAARGIGLHVIPMTAADHKRLGVPDDRGVLIDHVTPGSQAASMDLKAGEAIEQINDRPVRSPNDVPTRYGAADPKVGNSVSLLVRSEDKIQWMPMWVADINIASVLAEPPMPANAPASSNASAVTR